MEDIQFTALAAILPYHVQVIGGAERFTVEIRDIMRFLGATGQPTTYAQEQNNRGQLIENRDFMVSLIHQRNPKGGRPQSEYYYTFDAAKKICMMSEKDKGDEVREYFLECERRVQMLPTRWLETPTYERVFQDLAVLGAHTEKRVSVLEGKVALVEVALSEYGQTLSATEDSVRGYQFDVEQVRAYQAALQQKVEEEHRARLLHEQAHARQQTARAKDIARPKFPQYVIRAFLAIWGQQDCMYPGCKKTQIITRRDYEFDHVVAPEHGGTNDIRNIGLICVHDNRVKGKNRIPEYRPEWLVLALDDQYHTWREADLKQRARLERCLYCGVPGCRADCCTDM